MNNDEDIEVLEPLKKEEVLSVENDNSLENNVKTNNTAITIKTITIN